MPKWIKLFEDHRILPALASLGFSKIHVKYVDHIYKDNT